MTSGPRYLVIRTPRILLDHLVRRISRNVLICVKCIHAVFMNCRHEWFQGYRERVDRRYQGLTKNAASSDVNVDLEDMSPTPIIGNHATRRVNDHVAVTPEIDLILGWTLPLIGGYVNNTYHFDYVNRI
jgi:hypothetical protein